MFILNSNEKRILRKHFADKGIPLTLDNVKKYVDSGVLKQVMIDDAVSSGMTPEQARQFYDNFVNRVSPGAADEKIEGDLLKPETKEGVAEGAREEVVEAEQARQLGEDKRVKEEEEIDEGFTTEEIDSSVTSALTEEKPEPIPETEDTKLDDGLDLTEAIESEQEVLKKAREPVPPKKDVSDKKLYEEYGPEEGQTILSALDLGRKLAPGDKKIAGATVTGLEKGDVADATGAEMKTARQPAATESGVGVGLGSSPAMTITQEDREKGLAGITPKEQLATVARKADGLDPLTAKSALSAVDKLMRAKPGEPKLDKNGNPVIGKDGRPVMVGKVPLNLNQQEQLALAKIGVPQLFGGSGYLKTDRASEESMRRMLVNPEYDQMFKQLFYKLYSQATQTVPEDTERKEDIQDSIFGKQVEKLQAGKRHEFAMSAIDKKRMFDMIVKGFGQVAAGVTGNIMGADVGGQFKYDLTDFSPREKAEAQIYTTQLKKISDEIKGLEKLAYSPEKQQQRTAQLEKMLGHLGSLMSRTANRYEQGLKQNDFYEGLLESVRKAADLLIKSKAAARPRGGQSIKVQQTTSPTITQKASAQEKEQRTEFLTPEQRKQNSMFKRNTETFDELWKTAMSASPEKRRIIMVKGLHSMGASAPRELWNIYEKYLEAGNSMPDTSYDAHMLFNKWLDMLERGASARDVVESIAKSEVSVKQKGGAIPPKPGVSKPAGKSITGPGFKQKEGPKPAPTPKPTEAPKKQSKTTTFNADDVQSGVIPVTKIPYGGGTAMAAYRNGTIMLRGRGVNKTLTRNDGDEFHEVLNQLKRAQ